MRKALKKKNLLFDGAFGTYFVEKNNNTMLPELANTEQAELVKEIHKEYIRAGAELIRTNTFASNRHTLQCNEHEQKNNLLQACNLAKRAAKELEKTVFIVGDIGPLPFTGDNEDILEQEYLFMAETLLEGGVDALLFETFSEYQQVLPVIRRIKSEKPETFIMLHFSVNQYGYTNAGMSIRKLFAELENEESIDGLGLNCGVGPGHMLKIFAELPLSAQKTYAALPNASYPKLIQDRIVFTENRNYFVEKLKELELLGLDCVGGCCGTTPEYIAQAARQLDFAKKKRLNESHCKEAESAVQKPKHAFYDTPISGDKLIAVELSPPFGADDSKVLDAAYYLKDKGVDVVNFPDSPSGRTRADSVLMGVKIMEKTGMCTMPHVCCRDKNAIAIRSQLLGAYMNGIRNLLVVTGDPVPTLLRGDVKSVYNFDSVGFMRVLQELNEEEFADDPMVYGGALNPNRLNLQVEIERMKKKMQAGASFFLTQPLFTDEDIEHLRQIKEAVPARILCGIMPLVSRKNAVFIQNEMAGIHVTDEIVARYDAVASKEDGEAIGIALAKEIMKKTEDIADGYYFSIPFNRVQLLPRILDI